MIAWITFNVFTILLLHISTSTAQSATNACLPLVTRSVPVGAERHGKSTVRTAVSILKCPMDEILSPSHDLYTGLDKLSTDPYKTLDIRVAEAHNRYMLSETSPITPSYPQEGTQ